LNRPKVVVPTPTIMPVARVVAPPASQPTSRPEPPRTVLDVVRRTVPDFPTTQPLGVPVELSEAARLIFPHPVYLSAAPRLDVWLTHPDAPAVDDVLRSTPDLARQQTFVTRERVLHVHWLNTSASDEEPSPVVVVRAPDGSIELVDKSGRRAAPLSASRAYAWQRAVWFDNAMVLPFDTGVSVVRFMPEPVETSVDLPGKGGAFTVIDAGGGLLAWTSDVNTPAGVSAVARYVTGAWTMLDPVDGWSSCPLQLVPLLDGSVLQISAGRAPDVERVELKLIPLGANVALIDEAKLAALVEQMSDLSQVKRDAATDELSRYGPEVWSTLEKLMEDEPPEVISRMRRVMGSRLQPTIAGMRLIDGTMSHATRLRDGGSVFYARSGVAIARRDGGDDVIAPTWIFVRPGRPVARLPDALLRDLRPDKSRLTAAGNEWVLIDPARGPRRLLGNRLVPLLRKAERDAGFDDFVGIDRRGRWLFQKLSDTPGNGPTLIIDPTLPDPTPRLPAWTFAEGKEAGWTDDAWPAVRRGSVWSLREQGWQLVDPKKPDALRTTLPAAPVERVRTPASTQPGTTQPKSVEERYGRAVLITLDGMRWFDGRDRLVRVTSDGDEQSWPLPPEVIGPADFPVTLVQTNDGRLYLFNQPGRVIRIRLDTSDDTPLVVEATFTRDVPHVSRPTRVWLDPAGRINMVHDNKLTVFFPGGSIPQGIRNLMPARVDDDEP